MDKKSVTFSERLKSAGLALVIVCFLVVAFFALWSREPSGVQAQKALFYPSTCLGGWQQSKNASGVPDAEDGQYSLKNSAVYEDNSTDIFCGEFLGDLPPQTYHTRVTLRFSWEQVSDLPTVIKEEESLVETLVEMFVGNKIDDSTSTSTLDDSSANEDETGGSLADDFATTTATEVSVATTTELSEESADDSIEVEPSAEEDLPNEVIETPSEEVDLEVDVEPVEPESEPIEPELTPSEAAPSLEEVSFLPWFFSVAEAEELVVAESSTTTILTNPLATTTEDLSIATTTAPEEESKLGVVTDEPIFEDRGDAQFAVEYTLDGQTWQSIGFVSTVDNDVRFELPKEAFATLSDITNLQIALRPLSRFDDVATIYLDAMWLEVAYTPVRELGVHMVSSIVPEVIDFDELITTSTTSVGQVIASSTLVSINEADFANNLLFIHGIDDRFASVGVILGTTTELWLFDLYKSQVIRIGFGEASLGAYPIAAKDNMLFWLNHDASVIYTYDLRTAGSLHEMALVLNLPKAEDNRFTFPFTDWQVIWRSNQFYFYKDSTGEVFEDENTSSAEKLLAKFRVPAYLSKEQLETVGGVYLPLQIEEEIKVEKDEVMEENEVAEEVLQMDIDHLATSSSLVE